MGEFKSTAYLREIESSGQCELAFDLNVQLEKIGRLKEEVRAVRQISDTVESLLKHIVNKINKSINTLKASQKNCGEGLDVEVKVSLKSGLRQKPVKPQMVLKNIINSEMKNIVFQIFNQHFIVVVNAPCVKDIKLPNIIYANFTVQPSRLYMLFADNNMSEFLWFKSKNKVNWTKVGSRYRYKATDEDIGHYLKLVCVPCNNVLTGPPAEVVSENVVREIGDLPVCPFEQRHAFTKEKLTNNCFRLVSYNILSNRYAQTNENFPYCPAEVLAIDYRKQLIVKELLGYQADIICLQEVDSTVYISYYKDKLEDYISYYHKKGDKIPEGLACFFNKSRFKKLDERQIIYSLEIRQNELLTNLWRFVKSNTSLKDLFMKQLTSLQITVLKLKESKQNHCIVLGNTHLFYRPDAEMVRVLQIHIAATYLHLFVKRYSQNGHKNVVRVILCGDFNSVPSSAVYEYMTLGKLDRDHRVFEQTNNNINLINPLHFESACGLPKYTNYTSDFKDCLDYIFIEKNKLKVHKIIPFPKEEELAEYEGLPNDVYPSDHLALVVDLEIN